MLTSKKFIEIQDKKAMAKLWNIEYDRQNDPIEILEKKFSGITQFEDLSM